MLTDILVYKIFSQVTLVPGTAILNAFWSLEADRTHWSLRGENNEVRTCNPSGGAAPVRACVPGAPCLLFLVY